MTRITKAHESPEFTPGQRELMDLNIKFFSLAEAHQKKVRALIAKAEAGQNVEPEAKRLQLDAKELLAMAERKRVLERGTNPSLH